MVEKCSSCTQMKTENTQLRKAIMDTHKNYVEVCNELLYLKQQLEGRDRV